MDLNEAEEERDQSRVQLEYIDEGHYEEYDEESDEDEQASAHLMAGYTSTTCGE